jgi:type II secretory pathway component PulF
MSKIVKYGSIAGIASLGMVYVLPAFAQMSTTTLGNSIDTVSQTTLDYFTTLIAKFWPFLLGGLLLVGVIGFAIGLIMRIWGKK